MKKLTRKQAYEMVRNDYTMLYRPMPAEFKALFPVVTVEIASEFGLHFTVNHNGKMSGMQSLSTTCKCNDICKARIRAAFEAAGICAEDPKKALREYIKQNPLATNISICGFCFSDSQQDYMTSMVPTLTRNYEILNGGIIHSDWIPVINALYFRCESFGDFASMYAVVNLYNLARKNRNTSFTPWTKNLPFFVKARDAGYKKPANLHLVYSSRYINRQADIPENAQDLVNAVFTVYTKEYAELHNIDINCGARSCLNCLRCYTGYKKGEVKIVNEMLK